MLCVDIKNEKYFCKKCSAYHPTHTWHDKYDESFDKSNFVKNNWEICKRFVPDIPKSKAIKNYHATLKAKNIMWHDKTGECAICGAKTHFTNTCTNHYVCSDECKYKDDNN